MRDFAIIPVIDLKGGMVVHAAGGKRADYRPLVTPLGPAEDALAIGRALTTLTGADALYVADLDAIEGTGNHFELCRDLADSLPEATLWIDAGFSTVAECAFWLPLGATLVIGSESLEGLDAWEDIHASFGQSVVLSLDFEGSVLRGPERLLDEPALWPERIIAMQLDRVGLSGGLDVERVKEIRGRNNACAVFAAGGVRNAQDLLHAAEAGAAGALIATALHEGTVTQKEIAALREERRP